MRLQNQYPFGHARQEVEKFPRLIQVVKQAAAEGRVEQAVRGYVPNVVADKFEIRQIDPRLNVAASFDVLLAHVESQRLKTQARKFDGIAALETTQVRDAELRLFAGKRRIQNPLCRQKPRMDVERQPGIRLGVRAIVQSNIVRSETDHGCPFCSCGRTGSTGVAPGSCATA